MPVYAEGMVLEGMAAFSVTSNMSYVQKSSKMQSISISGENVWPVPKYKIIKEELHLDIKLAHAFL